MGHTTIRSLGFSNKKNANGYHLYTIPQFATLLIRQSTNTTMNKDIRPITEVSTEDGTLYIDTDTMESIKVKKHNPKINSYDLGSVSLYFDEKADESVWLTNDKTFREKTDKTTA